MRGPANASDGLAATPEDDFSVGGGGEEARAQKKMVNRCGEPKGFLTEDEAWHEQRKAIQAVHPHLTCASQNKREVYRTFSRR